MNVPLTDELLLIEGEKSFLLVGKAPALFVLCIETTDSEYCQTVEKGDLIIVSAPEGGPVTQAQMLLELVRKYHTPLIVLPKDHPGSERLRMVVSVAPEIHLKSEIIRGTHPEQHLICSSDEMNDLRITTVSDGINIEADVHDGDHLVMSDENGSLIFMLNQKKIQIRYIPTQ